MISIANIHDDTPLSEEAIAKLREIFESDEEETQ